MTQYGNKNLVISILSLQKRKLGFTEGLQTQRAQKLDVKHDLAVALTPCWRFLSVIFPSDSGTH